MALAQIDAGKITGAITDPTGAAVAGAKVVATNQGTGVLREVTTDNAGLYSFPALPNGQYTIAVAASGFQTSKQLDVVLDASASRSVNFNLLVGQTSQEVTVDSTSQAQVETNNAQVTSTITGKQIEDIALNGRNYIQLLRLLPGTVATTLDPFAIQLGAMAQYVNGIRGASILTESDGIILLDIGGNLSVFSVPSPDSIAETRVLQASFSAENPSPYGGATINVVTKGGTRDFHGNVFEFVRNNLFNAKPDFATSVVPLHFNDYGFTLGGPLYIPGRFNADRKRLFFFASEEWKIIHQGAVATGTVPTVAQSMGVFTTPVYQPGTKTLYPSGSCTQNPSVLNTAASGYCIPQSAFSVNGPKLLAEYPLPNVAGGTNFSVITAARLDNREDRYNIDYNASEKDLFAIRFDRNSNNQEMPGPLNVIPFVYGPRPAFLYSVSYTRTFTPNLLNTLTIGETHNTLRSNPDLSKITIAALGTSIPLPYNSNIFGIPPSLTITGLTSSPGPALSKDSKSVQNLILGDDLSWVKKSHTMKFGVYFQKSKVDEHNLTSSLTNGSASFNTGAALTSGQAIGDVLLGNFQQFTQSSIAGFISGRYLESEAYAQDNWHINKKLVVEYGVRYDFPQLPYSELNNLSVFNPALYSAALAPTVSTKNGSLSGSYNPYNGIQIVGNSFTPNTSAFLPNLVNNPAVLALFANLPRGFEKTPKTNVAPRAGVAYDVFGNGKTSIRFGYGFFYQRLTMQNLQAPSQNLPFNQNAVIQNGSLDNPGGSAGASFPTSLFTFPAVYKTPTIQTRNFGIEQQLPGLMILEANYVGNQGIHLPLLLNINQLQPGTVQANPGINANALRPYKGYADIDQVGFSDTTNYNALQATVRRRVGRGFNFSTSFTWSKTMEGTSQNISASVLPENSYNVKADYSVADIHRSKVLTANSTYDLPFFHTSSSRLLRESLGGWTVSGVFLFQTGAPLNISIPTDIAGISTSTLNSGMTQRPNIQAGVNPSKASLFQPRTGAITCPGGQKLTCQYFNTAAFSLPAAGTFGNASRNIAFGPWFTSTDVSVYKHFNIRERVDAQLRAESFNIFNHDSLTSVGTVFGTSTFGTVTAAAPGRVLQFAVKAAF